MTLFVKEILNETFSEAISGMSYLIGHGILEELIKFFAFFIAFHINKPSSIREIVHTGMMVGVGFAILETLSTGSGVMDYSIASFVLRTIGHALFTGMIALFFGLGYFMQMRWIDHGARAGVQAWLVRYEEHVLQILWTVIGLILSVIMHAGINIFSALGLPGIGIVFLLFLWGILVAFLLRPESNRPYGIMLRQFDLLRQIAEAKEDLEDLEESRSKSLSKQKEKMKAFAKQ